MAQSHTIVVLRRNVDKYQILTMAILTSSMWDPHKFKELENVHKSFVISVSALHDHYLIIYQFSIQYGIMIVWIGPCCSCEVVGQPDAGRGLVGLVCPACICVYIYIYIYAYSRLFHALE